MLVASTHSLSTVPIHIQRSRYPTKSTNPITLTCLQVHPSIPCIAKEVSGRAFDGMRILWVPIIECAICSKDSVGVLLSRGEWVLEIAGLYSTSNLGIIACIPSSLSVRPSTFAKKVLRFFKVLVYVVAIMRAGNKCMFVCS